LSEHGGTILRVKYNSLPIANSTEREIREILAN
jgi:hypothetical protein